MTDPGALEGVDFGSAPPTDLHATLAALRERAPVVRVPYLNDSALLFTRYEDVATVFTDEESFPSAAAYSLFSEPVQGRTMQCMGGEEHRVHRALVSSSFRPAVIRETVEALLEPTAEELADGLDGSDEVELVRDFATHLPFLVITRLLGIPPTEVSDFRRWADALFSYPWDPDGATAASAEFTRYLVPVVADRREQPQDDLLSRLATAEIDDADGTRHRLTDEEIFSFVRLLFPAGADTTYLALGSMLFALLSTPGAWDRVRARPEARGAAVEEALRWEPPVALQPRRTVRPSHWGGVDVPADAWVLFGVTAANRDPDVFARPDDFDLDRRPARPVLTFGQGPHFCLGAHLARAEMRTTIDVLTRRFPHMTLGVAPEEVSFAGAILRGPKAVPALPYGTGPG